MHVTSEREHEAVIKIAHPKTITILPNFVKLADHKLSPQNTTSHFLKLLFFSRIEEKKGLDILIKALAIVSVPYHLTIAGNGDENYVESLKALAISNNIDDKISWTGFRHENKFDLLNEHDLFVLPSYDENFGNTVIESLSVGTAVLISEQVGLADYVKKNNLGWICQTNEASLRQAINDIAKNHANLSRIRKDAPDIIYDDFNEDKLVKRYIAMYDQLITR